MVDIAPFRGLIYNSEKVDDLSKIVSPPYDVVTGEKRQELFSCSPENIINLILPEGNEQHKYKNASGILKKWINSSVLVYDDYECFYALEIGFKTGYGIKKLKGFIGLTRIEDYSTGAVLRHEKTLSGPKKDRYSLLENCRANFGLIYTIYKDTGEIGSMLDNNLNKDPFLKLHPCYDRNLEFSIWRINSTEDIRSIVSSLAGKPILIADGHHRYETSLMYKKNHISGGSEDYVLTLFMDSGQKDLKIYPTHRCVSFKNRIDINSIIPLLDKRYDLKPVPVKNGYDINNLLGTLKDSKLKGFILYFEKVAYSAVLKPGINKDFAKKPEVFILHDDLLKTLDDSFKIGDISFNHNEEQVLKDIDNGKHNLGIFLNPPSINDMERICYSGGLMPQKSTYFWPKPCTGLVMYKFK